MPEVSVMVEGGKASPAAPLGPALGPLGVNISKVVQEINEKTKNYSGMKVPVKIKIDSKKNFEISVGSPPVSSLILSEAKIKKGTGNQRETKVADLKFEQVIKLAKMKATDLNSSKLKSQVCEVLGSCNSLGITVEGKTAKQMIAEIKQGSFDSQLN
ncbi:MAG: 50S ribosomal protein L11 [Candidatus Diapherotrites archaeon CG10_big_fil_rev_8_21_14_0_10_31_34]|nr:MAG: 50S ribosomal protein L11 [Candidatus Diapherotrites archaeon CG10_big_fil_rev_8_21_14_0_10_31_34]